MARCKLIQNTTLIVGLLVVQLLAGTTSVCAATGGDAKSTPPAHIEKLRSIDLNKPEKVVGATVSGQILIQGKTPMANGIVFLFDKSTGPPPSRLDKYWRVPDRITSIDKNGKFLFEVIEGTYYLTAAQKDPDADVGPPQADEFHYFHGDEAGTSRPINVSSGSQVELGVLVPFIWSPDSIQRD